MPSVILYTGDATPSDIVVREFISDAPVSTTVSTDIIVYLEPSYSITYTPGISDLVLYAGEASPSDIVLRTFPVINNVAVSPNVIVTLRLPGELDEEGGGEEFPVQYAGLRTFYGSAMKELCLVAIADAPTGMGGIVKINKNGTLYAIYLVETSDPNASNVRIKTSTGTKAVRLKT